MTAVSETRPLAERLGRDPFPHALKFWAIGVGFCFAALEVNEHDAVWGPIMMGLATFVNFFCFVQGVNHAKRAIARWRTLYKAHKLKLSPDTVYNAAGFIVIDLTRGYLICNGRVADFKKVTRLVCKSNFMVHKIDLLGPWRIPITIGFVNSQTLFTAADALRDSIRAITGQDPEFEYADAVTKAVAEQTSNA